VSPEYFHTLQISLVGRARLHDGDDMQSPQVMIVNQAFAEKYFHGENPPGKEAEAGRGNGTPGRTSVAGDWWRGGNIHSSATQREMDPMQYLPASQLFDVVLYVFGGATEMDPMSLDRRRGAS